MPRFVSAAKNKIFVRRGPSLEYPIRWVFQRAGLPLEVIDEYDAWRKVRDIDSAEGWVHQSLLSGRRTVMVESDNTIPLYHKPFESGREIALIEPRVIARVRKCRSVSVPVSEGESELVVWCEIESGGFRGWIHRKHLWGIYPHEELD